MKGDATIVVFCYSVFLLGSKGRGFQRLNKDGGASSLGHTPASFGRARPGIPLTCNSLTRYSAHMQQFDTVFRPHATVWHGIPLTCNSFTRYTAHMLQFDTVYRSHATVWHGIPLTCNSLTQYSAHMTQFYTVFRSHATVWHGIPLTCNSLTRYSAHMQQFDWSMGLERADSCPYDQDG